mgnify:CR=1 FL=1
MTRAVIAGNDVSSLGEALPTELLGLTPPRGTPNRGAPAAPRIAEPVVPRLTAMRPPTPIPVS